MRRIVLIMVIVGILFAACDNDTENENDANGSSLNGTIWKGSVVKGGGTGEFTLTFGATTVAITNNGEGKDKFDAPSNSYSVTGNSITLHVIQDEYILKGTISGNTMTFPEAAEFPASFSKQ